MLRIKWVRNQHVLADLHLYYIYIYAYVKALNRVTYEILAVFELGGSSSRFLMTARILTRYRNHKDQALRCIRCNEPIEEHEDTVSKRTRRKQRHYHARCYEGTLHYHCY